MFLLLTLNIFLTFFCFYYWIWACIYSLWNFFTKFTKQKIAEAFLWDDYEQFPFSDYVFLVWELLQSFSFEKIIS